MCRHFLSSRCFRGYSSFSIVVKIDFVQLERRCSWDWKFFPWFYVVCCMIIEFYHPIDMLKAAHDYFSVFKSIMPFLPQLNASKLIEWGTPNRSFWWIIYSERHYPPHKFRLYFQKVIGNFRNTEKWISFVFGESNTSLKEEKRPASIFGMQTAARKFGE